MIFSYCRSCLPGTKVVLGYSERIADLRTPHNAHAQTEKNGWATISFKEWETTFVDGDDAQTKANIVANFPNRFE